MAVIRDLVEALVPACQNCYEWALPLSPFSSGRSSAECLGQGVLVHLQSGVLGCLGRLVGVESRRKVFTASFLSYLVLMSRGM
jgi:hypothetical protein